MARCFGAVNQTWVCAPRASFVKQGLGDAWLKHRKSGSLFNHGIGVFVLSQPNKLRMPEPIRLSPLQELNLSNGLRAKSNSFLHFLRSQFVAPTRLVGVRRRASLARQDDEFSQKPDSATRERTNSEPLQHRPNPCPDWLTFFASFPQPWLSQRLRCVLGIVPGGRILRLVELPPSNDHGRSKHIATPCVCT